MAINQTPSHKPLNPNAPPYLQSPRHLHIYFLPHYHPHTALPYTPLQQLPRKSPPKPPSPASDKRLTFSLTPVPSGPRIPKSRTPKQRGGRTINAGRFGNSSSRSETKWVPKVPETLRGFEGRRWKNNRGGYKTVLPLEANTTSLMIKNIPNKYTRKLMIQTLDDHCAAENMNAKGFVSAYDFLYLPIDFNRRLNAGFAFVNFTSPEAALRFRDAFNGQRWNLFDSSKVAEISRARIQGKTALVNNCKRMDFSYGSEEDMPVWFAPERDGSGSGQVESKMFTVGKFSSGN